MGDGKGELFETVVGEEGRTRLYSAGEGEESRCRGFELERCGAVGLWGCEDVEQAGLAREYCIARQ